MEKFRLLTEDDIEVKIKQVKQNGLVCLLYKTARTDMDVLDEALGPENWAVDYKEIKGNLYCGIGIRESKDEPFIWKWNCGIESRADGDGNEKKGEASDAMKRAGFCVGVGRELYTAPFTWISNTKCKIENGKCYDKFSVEKIGYDEHRRIVELNIWNDTQKCMAFEYKKPSGKKQSKPESGSRQAKYICGECGTPFKTFTDKNGRAWTPKEQYEIALSRSPDGVARCGDCRRKMEAKK